MRWRTVLSQRFFKWMTVAGLAAGVSTANSHLTQAQPAWETFPIPGHNLATQSLHLDQRWNGGVLRVRLMSAAKLPSNWRLQLDYGDGLLLDIDASTAAGRMVGSSGQDQLTLDLPVLAPRTLTVQVSPAGLRLLVVEVLFPSRVNSQQMIGDNPKIDLFDAEVGPLEKAVGPAFGRLDLLGEHGELLGNCTGFRVALRYWLTAAHCIARDSEDPERGIIARIRLQPLDYVDREGAQLFTAVPVATGQSGGQADATKYLRSGELDYAVLEVQGDPGGPAFPLTGAVTGKVGDELQLFQHWTGSFSPPAGKARCTDTSCVIDQRIGANDPGRPELCPNALQHGCSSAPGASGGPVVVRSTLQLVGLHYRGGLVRVFNCALPIVTIRKHLCENKPDLAKRISSCD